MNKDRVTHAITQAAREQQLRDEQRRQQEADAAYHGPRWWERDAS